jgi:phospholipase/lecithinase/hemolysin
MATNHLRKALAVLIAASLLLAIPGSLLAGKKQDLVIFGDSLSDTGNRFYFSGVKNTPPYDLVAEQGLVPSFPYAIGGATYTNGAVWVEHLAHTIGKAGASQAALNSNGIAANYAFGGAQAANEPPLPDNLLPFNFPEQVSQYLADVNYGASKDALHVIFIGSNDIAQAVGAFLQGSAAGAAQIITNAVGSVANNVVGELYFNGGARRFLIVTAPNVGNIPLLGGGQIPQVVFLGGQLTDSYNGGLQAFVIDPLVSLGAEVNVLNGRELFDDMLAHPENFGLTNTNTHCITPFEPPFRCQDPNAYTYWDNIHPTAAVHEILGQAAIAVMAP